MYSSAEAMYCVIAALEAFSYDGEGFFTFRREQNIRKLYLMSASFNARHGHKSLVDTHYVQYLASEDVGPGAEGQSRSLISSRIFDIKQSSSQQGYLVIPSRDTDKCSDNSHPWTPCYANVDSTIWHGPSSISIL